MRAKSNIGTTRLPTFTSESASMPLEYDSATTSLHWDRTLLVGSLLTATVVGLHIYQRNAWWSDQRGSFHIVEDPDYALSVDKAGHFFGGAFGAFIGMKSAQWSGVAHKPSVAIGSAIGGLFELYVEFEDGFARDWGFSPGDAEADVLGALFPLAQLYVPYMEHLQPQFQYWPSPALLEGRHHGGIFIDDYDGQTYWMALHVAELMPASWKSYWLEWLGVAFGVRIRNIQRSIDENNYGVLERSFLIGLDYDWTKILPGDGWWMMTLKHALNFLHFPAPAIQISPRLIAFGFYH